MTDEAFAEIFKDMLLRNPSEESEGQRSQETRDRVFANLLGETRVLNEYIATQVTKMSEMVAHVAEQAAITAQQAAITAQQLTIANQILERVVQTTDRTERMTTEVLTRLARSQDPAQ